MGGAARTSAGGYLQKKQKSTHPVLLRGWPFTRGDSLHSPVVKSKLQFFPTLLKLKQALLLTACESPTPACETTKAAPRINSAARLRSKRRVFIFRLHP